MPLLSSMPSFPSRNESKCLFFPSRNGSKCLFPPRELRASASFLAPLALGPGVGGGLCSHRTVCERYLTFTGLWLGYETAPMRVAVSGFWQEKSFLSVCTFFCCLYFFLLSVLFLRCLYDGTWGPIARRPCHDFPFFPNR